MVYAMGPDDELDSMSVGMITNNKIPGLMKAVFTQMDTNKFIKYNVSSKIPVKQFFSAPINKKRLLGVCRGIADAMLSAEEYMIDPSTVVIDLEYMFADVSTGETTLICLPILQRNPQSVDLGGFFKNLIFTTQFDQTEDCGYVAKIINYLNSAATFSVEQFRKVLNEIDTAPRSVPATAAGSAGPGASDTKQGKTGREKKQPVPQPVPSAAPAPAPKPPVTPPKSFTAPVPPTPQQHPAQRPSSGGVPQPAQPQATGEKMSLFYLLQHYNKENAAAYKAQKEQKKSGQAAPTAPKKATKAPKQSKPTKAAKQQKGPSFAIPGQSDVPVSPVAPAAPPAPMSSPAPVAPTPSAPPVSGTPAAVASNPAGAPAPFPVGSQIVQNDDDFGGTVYLPHGILDDSATVIMGQGDPSRQIVPHLIRRHNNEKIPITKPIFRLGRDEEFNDYAIVDNVFVGHSHCHIISRDGKYFVVDDNSKNRTSVDGTYAAPGQEVRLVHGCTICIANEEFEFRLY